MGFPYFHVLEIHQEVQLSEDYIRVNFVKRMLSCAWNTPRRLCRWGEFSYMVCEEEITTANRIKMLSTSLLSNLHSGLKCIQPIQTDSEHQKSQVKILEKKFPRLCEEEIWWECEICYGISSIISPFVLIPQRKVACLCRTNVKMDILLNYNNLIHQPNKC